MPNVLTRPPRLKRTVVYFKPLTGERVPAQVTSVIDTNTVNLRLADGTTVNNVPRIAGRQGFGLIGAWGYVRSPVAGSATLGGASLFTPATALPTGVLKAWYEVPSASGVTLVSDDFTRTPVGPVVKVSDTFTRTPVVTDDFSEANGTNLSGKATDTGQVWATLSGAGTVTSAKATGTGKHIVESGLADVAVAVTLANAGTDNGPMLRVTDVSNYYYLRVTNFAGILMTKVVAGASTTLASGGGNTGGVLEVRAIASSLTVRQNGSTVITTTDSTYLTQTKHGLFLESSVTFDDFSVTRADLGTAETGETWVEGSNEWGIDSLGRAYCVNPAGAYRQAVIDNGQSDVDVVCAINFTATAANFPGLTVRYLASNNMVLARQEGADPRTSLSKMVAGVVTAIISAATPNLTTGATLRVVATGTLYQQFVGTGLVGTVSTTIGGGIDTATKHGISGYGTVTTTTYDNFSISTPATGVSDDFSEADGTSLNGKATDTGQVWSVLSGTWQVTGGKVTKTLNATAYDHAVVETGLADVSVQATVSYSSVSGSQASGVVARAADVNNLIRARLSAGDIAVQKIVGGVTTALSNLSASMTVTGDLLELRCIGSSLIVLMNGVQKLAVTDAAGATNTKHGLVQYGAGVDAADNFSVTRADLGYATGLNGAQIPWVEGAGEWGIDSSGKAKAYTSVAYSTVYLFTGVSDVEVQGTISAITTTIGVIARYVDQSNFVYAQTSSTFRIDKRVAGADTTLASGTTPVVGDVIKFQCIGSALKLFRNGTQLHSVTDAALSTATKQGIYTYTDTTTTLDSFSVKTPTLAAGDGISVLPDLSGNGNHAVQTTAANQPKYGFGTVTDTFTRANGAIGTAETGQAWTALAGTWVISGNKATKTAGNTADDPVVVETGMPDFDTSVTIVAHDAGRMASLAFRASDVNNHWRFGNAAGSYSLQKTVASVATTLASGAQVQVGGDIVRIVAKGSSIVAYYNGVQKASITDSALSTNTKHGINVRTENTAQFDNFSVTSLANGKAVGVFDNSNDCLIALFSPPDPDEATYIAVVRRNGQADNDYLLTYGNFIIYASAGADLFRSHKSGVGDRATTALGVDTAVVAFTNQPTLTRVHKNGAEGTASTGIVEATASPLYIASNNGAQPWNGDIVALLVFEGALSYTDRRLVEAYLATKYGITLAA